MTSKCMFAERIGRSASETLARLITFMAVGAMLTAWVPSTAQTASIYSSIVGAVSDPSGAVIPGATVTVINPATNLSYSGTTDSQGLYRVERLTLGTYNVVVRAAGFKTTENDGINLASGQDLRVDFLLQTGSVEQTVTVSSAAPLLNVESSQITNSFDWQARKYMAVSVPSFTVLPDLNPATTITATPNTFSFAGSLPKQYDYQINGVSFTTGGIPGVYVEWASDEEVDYVNNGAQYQSIAVVNATMKSGTNQWHGGVDYQYGAGGFGSHDPFSSAPPSGVRNLIIPSISGPIIKNRLFFYAGIALRPQPGTSLYVATVPTPEQAAGDFSGSPSPIIDPQTGLPFPGNKIPANRISPVSSAFIKEFYPAPNASGVSNFQAVLKVPSDADINPYGRIDYKISDKNSLFGNYILETFDNGGPLSGTLPVTAFQIGRRTSQEFGATDVESFTPKLLNEFGIGFARDFFTNRGPVSGPTVIQTIGLQGIPLFPLPGIPPMSIQGYTTVQQGNLTLNSSDTYMIRDSVSWIHGRHTMKFGVSAADYRSGSYPTQPNNLFGSFSFTSTLKGGAQNALANFLLGIPTSESRQLELNRQHYRRSTWQVFAQDNIEATRNLTVNVGLRYEHYQPFNETSGQIYTVDPLNGNIILPSDRARALVPTQVLNNPAFVFQSASQAGYPESLTTISEKNFAPRIGIAYRIGSKTVVRGGYGLFFDFIPPQATPSDLFNVQENFVPNTITAGVPAYAFPNPFAANPSPVGTLGLSSYAKHLRMPYTQQWSTTVERQLFLNGALRVSYIGSHTAEVLYGKPANIPALGTTPFTQSRRPLPQFGQLTSYQSGADFNYNALTGQLQYRNNAGIYASVSYTWSKNLGIGVLASNSEVPVVMNPYNPSQDYGNVLNPSDLATAVLSIPIPVGHGRKYASGAPWLEDAVLGGWILSSNVILRSGDHLTPTYSGFDSTGTGILTGRPDVIGNPNLPRGKRYINHWYNTAAFAYPGANPASPLTPPAGPIGRFGNAGVGIIDGPGYNQVDMGLAKEFQLYERLRMGLYGLATNAFNHSNYADPNLTISAPNLAGTITSIKADQDRAGGFGNRMIQVGVRIEF